MNVLTVPGLDVVGPFSADLQQDVVFTAALDAGTKQAGAAKALVDYLKTPEAISVIRSKGMTPGVKP